MSNENIAGWCEEPQVPLHQIFPLYISERTRTSLINLCQNEKNKPLAQEHFAQKCIAYIRSFRARYPEAIKALFVGEVLGGSRKQQRIRKRVLTECKGDNMKQDEIWSRAGEHTFTLGMLAEILAYEMKLSSDDIKRVTLAAIVHDYWKKHEIIGMRKAEERLKTNPPANEKDRIQAIRQAFDTTNKEHASGLRALGFPDDIVELSSANRLKNTQIPETDEHLIICYLDHTLSGIEPVPVIKRLDLAVAENPSYALYEESFRDDLEGQTEHELFRGELGTAIQTRVAHRLRYSGSIDTLHDYVKALFVKKVEKFDAYAS